MSSTGAAPSWLREARMVAIGLQSRGGKRMSKLGHNEAKSRSPARAGPCIAEVVADYCAALMITTARAATVSNRPVNQTY
jgi:hypothetical protein